MARRPRIVIPGHPHHVTQRGNRRARVLFEDGDYQLYKDLLTEAARKAESEIWCYCLMPSHVHLVIVPSHEEGLRRTLADAHRRYTAFINARMRATGHLWQGRFGSVVTDEAYHYYAVRYISLNPVRAKLVTRAKDWPWSSVVAHMAGKDDGLATVAPVLDRYGDLADLLDQGQDDEGAKFMALRCSETTGRPLGVEEWIKELEQRLGKTLMPKKRGPKKKDNG